MKQWERITADEVAGQAQSRMRPPPDRRRSATDRTLHLMDEAVAGLRSADYSAQDAPRMAACYILGRYTDLPVRSVTHLLMLYEHHTEGAADSGCGCT